MVAKKFTEKNWVALVSKHLDNLVLTEKVKVRMDKGSKYLEIVTDERKGIETSCRVFTSDLEGYDTINMMAILEKKVGSIGITTNRAEEARASVVRPGKRGELSEEEAVRLHEMLTKGAKNIGGTNLSAQQLDDACPTDETEVNKILGNKGEVLENLEDDRK